MAVVMHPQQLVDPHVTTRPIIDQFRPGAGLGRGLHIQTIR
jgi:hypothetical protein